MITSYRLPSTTKITSNVANIKQRHHPTNTHTRIFHFSQQPLQKQYTKCTPTFHSQIFDISSPRIPSQHSINRPHSQIAANVAYQNNTKQQRQVSLNRGMKESDGIGAGMTQFNDNHKQQLIKNIVKDQSFSRTRKLAELSSTAIYDLSIKHPHNKQINYNTYLPSQSFQ